MASLAQDLRSLGDSPRELWTVYGIKFLESVAYFAIYNLLALYLSEDLHFTDIQAGTIAGAWLTLVSVLMFMSGFVADSMGIRRALLIAVTSCLLGRGVMAVSSTPAVSVLGLIVSAWGAASMLPTMTAAIRRYTVPATVSFGFSLFYVVMNVGAFVAPITIGALRKVFKQPVDIELPLFGHAMWSSSQIMFAIGTGATFLALLLTLSMRDDRVTTEGSAGSSASPLAILREVAQESAFWRFLLFVSLLVLVRLIFQHAHLTWPKYSTRELGKDFPWAWWWSLNPLMIIFLTPLATALTRRRPAFEMIVLGSFISGASVFFMAGSTTVAASALFIVVLSLGETIWSPRLYEYTALIAPKGREASYMGLSSIPMFVAKPIVGFTSGWMLATWCPEEGLRNSHLMWAVIGATTLMGPVAILLLRNVIVRKPAAEPVPG